MIINHRGNNLKTGLPERKSRIIIIHTKKFKTTINHPRIIIVDDISPEGSQGEYCKAKAKTKQILQIKAILEKNNKLGMGQLGVKLHYFAQSNPESFKTQSMRRRQAIFYHGHGIDFLFTDSSLIFD